MKMETLQDSPVDALSARQSHVSLEEPLASSIRDEHAQFCESFGKAKITVTTHIC